MSHKPRLNIDALIFSVHDVLIDVSRSYREVVCKTVQLYLEQAVGLLPSSEALLTPAEVTLLQKVGNFSNYLDLATTFIIYFIEMLPPLPLSPEALISSMTSRGFIESARLSPLYPSAAI